MAGQFFADGVADKFGTVRIFLSGALVQARQKLPGTQTTSNLPFGFFPEPRFMARCIDSIYTYVNIFLVFSATKQYI